MRLQRLDKLPIFSLSVQYFRSIKIVTLKVTDQAWTYRPKLSIVLVFIESSSRWNSSTPGFLFIYFHFLPSNWFRLQIQLFSMILSNLGSASIEMREIRYTFWRKWIIHWEKVSISKWIKAIQVNGLDLPSKWCSSKFYFSPKISIVCVEFGIAAAFTISTITNRCSLIFKTLKSLYLSLNSASLHRIQIRIRMKWASITLQI